MDDYLARRAGAAVMGAGSDREAELLAGYESSLERSRTLKGLLNVIEWNGGSDLAAQAGNPHHLKFLQVGAGDRYELWWWSCPRWGAPPA